MHLLHLMAESCSSDITYEELIPSSKSWTVLDTSRLSDITYEELIPM